MSKPNYKTVVLSIKDGQREAEKEIAIDQGEVVYVAAVQNGENDNPMRVSLHENGNEIHPAMNVKFYDGSIGNFKQRAIKLDYTGGASVTVRAMLQEAVSRVPNVYCEVVFLIEKQDTQCY